MNLDKLPPQEAQSLMADRLRNLLDLSPENARKMASDFYTHYSKFKIFPQTEGTLDASLRALAKAYKPS